MKAEGVIMNFSRKQRARRSSVISGETILWAVGILAGALLVSFTFFLEPLNRDFFAESKKVSAAEKEVMNPEVYNISTRLSEGASEEENERSRNLEVVTESEKNSSAITMEEYDILCRIVTAEANSEDVCGQRLVANVILNRVASDRFPDTIEDVVLSPGQFDPVESGYFYCVEPSEKAKEAVMQALNGEDESQGALYFQKSESTSWGNHEYLFRYGNHSFYR